jgi:hypothetical protein
VAIVAGSGFISFPPIFIRGQITTFTSFKKDEELLAKVQAHFFTSGSPARG